MKVGAYLILASVIIRVLVMFADQSSLPQALLLQALLLLASYSVLLVIYQRRRAWFAFDKQRAVMYLGVQSLLVVGLILIPPHFDYLPLLFIPLSQFAVELLERRFGFMWITAYGLAMLEVYVIDPLVTGQSFFISWSTGLAMTLLYTGSGFLVGQIAHIRQQAEATRQRNQQLLIDLDAAHRQLQYHAAQLEERAVMQERSRLARELHDSVTQTVFSMTLAVQAAQLLLSRDIGQVAAQLDRVVELARNASREIQVIIKQLRPASIADEGLVAALRDYLTERQARDGLIAHLEVKGEAAWPENVTLGLYRIVQEAVNNVIKHAGTREVTIKLNLCDRPACIEVLDHGAGFAASEIAPQRGHMGLASMAERARELGWALTIEAAPGQGTCVKVQQQ